MKDTGLSWTWRVSTAFRRVSSLSWWKRSFRFIWQVLRWGFSERSTWNLDVTAAEWLHPRLILFRKVVNCHPPTMTFEEWLRAIDEMIYAMEYQKSKFDIDFEETDWNMAKVELGFDNIGRYFRDLWW